MKANKSLVIRATEATDSEQIGVVVPGHMMTVLQEVVTDGKVRAMISLDSISKQPEAVGGALLQGRRSHGRIGRSPTERAKSPRRGAQGERASSSVAAPEATAISFAPEAAAAPMAAAPGASRSGGGGDGHCPYNTSCG